MVVVSILSATGDPAATLNVEVDADAAPGMKVLEAPVREMRVAGVATEIVFASALVVLTVQVETPVEATVAEHEAVFAVPVTESVGVVEIGLL